MAAGLGLAAVVTVCLLVATSLARSSPSWWRNYSLTETLRERATSVENAAVSQLYRTRPADPEWTASPDGEPWRSAPWSIAMKDADASAWLTARLQNWIEGDESLDSWPEGLAHPQVRFEQGRLRLGASLQFESGDRVVSAAMTPEFRQDGSLWVRTNWVHIGRLPLPAGPMLARADRSIRDEMPEEFTGEVSDGGDTAGLFDILRGDAPLAQRPVMRLDDGRSVRLLGIRLSEGRIEIDCQTVSHRTAGRN